MCWDPHKYVQSPNDLEKGMSSEIPRFPDDTVINVIGTRAEHTTAEISYEAS